nr:hypothetical protein [Phytohabitans flavus]
MPGIPLPCRGTVVAAPSLVTSSSTCPGSYPMVSRNCRGLAWRAALVNASWAMRTTARSTAAGSAAGGSGRVTVTSAPVARTRAASPGRSASDSAGSTATDPAARTAPSVARMSPSASRLASLIVESAVRANSGRLAYRASAASACRLITARWWLTASCSSRAIRSRSPSTARCRLCSRNARRARCASPAATTAASVPATPNRSASSSGSPRTKSAEPETRQAPTTAATASSRRPEAATAKSATTNGTTSGPGGNPRGSTPKPRRP